MSSKVERTAEAVLERFGITKPPVPVEELAKALGAEVLPSDLEDKDLSGMFFRRGPRTVILFNKGHHPNRQRFTVAHEIGHMLLHKDATVFVDAVLRRDKHSSAGIDQKEIQANQFAAALLMPRRWILAEVQRRRPQKVLGSDEELIARLASVFDVSQEALQYRLANLGVLASF